MNEQVGNKLLYSSWNFFYIKILQKLYHFDGIEIIVSALVCGCNKSNNSHVVRWFCSEIRWKYCNIVAWWIVANHNQTVKS